MDEVAEDRAARLRRAWIGSGLAQEAFAEALGTSSARMGVYLAGRCAPPALFVARAERVGRGLARARELGLASAPAVAVAVRGADDRVGAWLVLLRACDDLRVALSGRVGDLAGAWLATPGSTGDAELDLLLQALVAREFAAVGLAAPPWAAGQGGAFRHCGPGGVARR